MGTLRLTVLGLAAIIFLAAAPAERGEQWHCSLDLHQGDRGVLEIQRQDTRISGKTAVHRGETIQEHRISGEWSGAEIRFRRSLNAGSYQPFRGQVTVTGDGRVNMAGQFAANWAGTWSCECELVAVQPPASPARPAPAASLKLLSPSRPVTKVALSRPLLSLKEGSLLDLTQTAPEARWTNAWRALPFPGDPDNDLGFVRLLEDVTLEDGKSYSKVLQTHPQWRPHGIVVGRYANVEIPQAGAELRAGIGFLDGAGQSDGVLFEVWGEFQGYQGVRLRREYYKTYNGSVITDFSQDLSRFAGLTGTIAVVVNAGDSSSQQDWAVWVEPRLVSLARQATFPSFVGGAVGSRREGDRLLGAWGEILHGDVVLYLSFAHVDRELGVRIDSFFGDEPRGSTDLGRLRPGQTERWLTLRRNEEGRWRERVILDGTYVGDVRYQISRM